MRLLKHLLTYGKDADFDQINVAALAFSCDVYVYDIQTHQVQIISGQRPWDPQHIVVYVPFKVAYRRHKEIWAYDQNFSQLGPTPGDYWAIMLQPLSPVISRANHSSSSGTAFPSRLSS